MPSNAPGQRSLPLPGVIINALGDSITAGGSPANIYQPTNVSLANIPQWLPSTVYSQYTVVQNGGYPYYCFTTGTSASSGGPSTFGTAAITDGTAQWVYLPPTASKINTSYLRHIEAFSNGALVFDQSVAPSGTAGGLQKILIVSGGANYSAPTLSLSGGATATLSFSGGIITGATITNPGANVASQTYTISDTTGAGAVLSLWTGSSGTFGVSGCLTQDMVARLPYAQSSAASIFAILGGTNNIATITNLATLNSVYFQVTGDLKKCYEGLISSGKKVIAYTILPKYDVAAGFALRELAIRRVNKWIVAYCRQEPWANPLNITGIALADVTGYMADGTNPNGYPIGGVGGISGSVTVDGLHPSSRGGQYMGYVGWLAAQQLIGVAPAYAARSYTMADGYDSTLNPGGNFLEAPAWMASFAYTYIGQRCSNSGNIYRLKALGTSASSGGPTGTTSTITDGGCTWAFVTPTGLSVGASGTAGINTAATGIAYSGLLATGFNLYRNSGTASGTVTESIETPWSSGQTGQRQVITFSLGSGTAAEMWTLSALSSSYAGMGLVAGDLGSASLFAEAEYELSSVANLCYISLNLTDNSTGLIASDGSTTSSVGNHMINSSGDPLVLPNSGKLYRRTTPLLLPANLVNMGLNFTFGFDASGAAGSATLTLKVNYMALRKAGIA